MPANHRGNHKHANERWDVRSETIDDAALVVLQDIRHELQQLNNLMYRDNFVGIPNTLRAIRDNTSKPRRKKRKP